ncbi:MAG: hypothetical protein ABH891_00945 [Candidatus Omnitrophota bacterium]
MKIMEIQDRRPISPNVKMISREALHQFVSWFRAGMGLGLMLFTAWITFSALCHGANWIKDSAKQVQSRETGQVRTPVLSKKDYAAPVRVVRSAVVVQKSQDDYRMFREQARLVTDLSETVSRTMSRMAR